MAIPSSRISFRSSPVRKPPSSAPPRPVRRNQAELASPAVRAKTGDLSAQAKLIASHEGIFRVICRKYVYRRMDLDDLLQEARRGFLHAVCNRYDPTRGTSVTTYCVRWAEKFAQRATENESSTIRVPVWARTSLAASSREAPAGETPQLSESIRQAQAAIFVQPIPVGRLVEVPRALVDDSHGEIVGMLGCSRVGEKLLGLLDAEERAAVYLRVAYEMDFPDIAQILHERRIHDRLKTRQWIKILYMRSIAKMRRWLMRNGLSAKDFF